MPLVIVKADCLAFSVFSVVASKPTVKLPELSVAIVIGVVGIIPLTVVPFKIETPVGGLLAVSAFCLLAQVLELVLKPTFNVVRSLFAVIVMGSDGQRFLMVVFIGL